MQNFDVYILFIFLLRFCDNMPGLNADVYNDDEDYDLSYDNYSYGFHMISKHNHAKKHTDVVDITYNTRLRK